MEIKVRNVPDEIVLKMDAQARQLGISREEYLRRLLTVSSMNTMDNQLWHFRNALMQKLLKQLKKNDEILAVIQTVMN